MSGPSSGAVEREVKLGAFPDFAMPDLGEVSPGVTVEARPTLDLDATYVDTPELALVRNGASLRRRTGEGAARWTLKLPSGSSETTMARREFDVIDDGSTVPPELARLVVGWVRRSPLEPVAIIRSRRRRLSLHGSDGIELAEIDDDEVSVIDGDEVAARFREVEVELVDAGSEKLLTAVTDALVAAGAGAPDPTPKIARALGPRALLPPELTPVPLDPDATVADVVGAALARSARQIVDHDHVVRLDDDIEGVHKMRVATRRLRSDLQTLEPVLDAGWGDGLRVALKELAADLGAIRDTDVLGQRLRRHIAELPAGDRPVAVGIVDRLQRERTSRMATLVDVLDSDAYVDLLDEVVAGALCPHLGPTGSERAADVLPGLVRPRWKRLRRAVHQLGAHPHHEQLHEVRILTKRTRYAAELAAPVVGDAATDLATHLIQVQDVLGELQDTVVAEAWLRDIAPELDHDARFVAGQLAATQRSEREARLDAWPGAWAACDRKVLTRWFR